jgi:hypothetical protein
MIAVYTENHTRPINTKWRVKQVVLGFKGLSNTVTEKAQRFNNANKKTAPLDKILTQFHAHY